MAFSPDCMKECNTDLKWTVCRPRSSGLLCGALLGSAGCPTGRWRGARELWQGACEQ